jgi:hypothetical protein
MVVISQPDSKISHQVVTTVNKKKPGAVLSVCRVPYGMGSYENNLKIAKPAVVSSDVDVKVPEGLHGLLGVLSVLSALPAFRFLFLKSRKGCLNYYV